MLFLISLLCVLLQSLCLDKQLRLPQSTFEQQLNLSQPNKLNTSISDQMRTANGVYSPFNIFEYNERDLAYTTYIKIFASGQSSSYRVVVDINLPFTFIAQKQISNNNPYQWRQQYSKSTLATDQQKLVIRYLQNKFRQIAQYIDDVYFVVTSTLEVNSDLRLVDYPFFYLEGEGATLFEIQTNCFGFLGIGLATNEQFLDLNLIVGLYEQNLIKTLSYSTYYGNEPGYIDSVLFLGDYEREFLNQGNLTQINTFQLTHNTWCVNISNSSVQTVGNEPSYWSRKPQTACLDTTFPFIQLSMELMTAVVTQLESDGSLACEYKPFNFHDQYYDLLQCSSKLPVFELLKYPSINFNLTQTNGSNFTVALSAQNYIYSCWYDVNHYLKKCLTFLSLTTTTTMNSTAAINQTSTKKGHHHHHNQEDFIFGLPFLRTYYAYYNINFQTLYMAKSYEFYLIPEYSSFWYYTLLALLFFWSIIMITCGIYYKEQMNQMMVFVSNIIKYVTGDQEARRQLVMAQLGDEQQ